MAQTAVEWLIDQVEDFIGLIPVDIIEQAKQMEREQRFKDFKAGQDSMIEGGKGFEQYYTQTYGTRLQNETN